MPETAFLLGWIGRNQWRKQVWLPYAVVHHLRAGGYWVCADCRRVTLPREASVSRRVRPAVAINPAPGGGHEAKCGHCQSPRVEKARPLPDLFLWIHMPDEPSQDWDKPWLERQFDLKPGRDLHYTEGHTVETCLSPEDLPALYGLWDGLLYLSGGEGFGLPAWEAMSSGLPVIYTNYSSHAEYLGRAKAGLPVSGVLQPEGKSGIWRMIADISQAVEAVRKLYFDRALGQALGNNGRAFAQQYTPSIQAEHWHRIFQSVRSSDKSKIPMENTNGSALPDDVGVWAGEVPKESSSNRSQMIPL